MAQDGTSASLTAPNGRAQEKLLRSTLADGELSADEVDYLEAHGTGTALGDPIEMSSSSSVFGEGVARTVLSSWVPSRPTSDTWSPLPGLRA